MDTPKTAAIEGELAATRFIPQLESLRGIAALSVLLGHCYRMTGRIGGLPDAVEPLAWVLNIVFDPQPAVILFFVLSGFVLGIQLRREPVATPITYLSFLIRRFFRLVPALWLSILLASIIVAGGIPMPNAGFGPVEVLSLDTVLSALFLQKFSLNAATWSLHVEMTGSILFPFMFWIYSFRKVSIYLFVLTVFVSIGYYPAAPLSTQFLVCFFVGLIVSGLTAPRTPVGRVTLATAFVISVVVFFASPEIATLGARSWSVSYIRYWMWLCAAASVVIVTFCAQADRGLVSRILVSAPLRFFGKISYSLYLMHLPILLTLLYLYRTYALAPFEGLPAVSLVVAAVLLSVAAASFSHFIVERPFVRWGRTFASYVRHLDPRYGAVGISPADGSGHVP